MDEAPYKYQAFPAWRYDPKTGEGRVFDSEAEVPAGWTDKNPRPDPHAEPVSSEAEKKPVTEPSTPPAKEPSGVDAAGTPFDAARHTGTKTKAGLWRMRVGVSRPEAEGVIKTLDL